MPRKKKHDYPYPTIDVREHKFLAMSGDERRRTHDVRFAMVNYCGVWLGEERWEANFEPYDYWELTTPGAWRKLLDFPGFLFPENDYEYDNYRYE